MRMPVLVRFTTIMALLTGLTHTNPAYAENGMRESVGPCWPIATATERSLMRRESRGWPTADNPRSTAFGCGQLLAGNRHAFAPRCHTNADTVNAAAQMCLMRAYITTRYRTSARALLHSRRHGWF